MFASMFRFLPLLSFIPMLLCWDAGGEGGGGGAGGGTGTGTGTGTVTDPPVDKAPKFTQDDVNRFLTEDRRRNGGAATKQVQTLQAQLQNILEGKDLPEGSAIRTQIDELQNSLLGEKEVATKAQQKLAKQLEAAMQAATGNESKYKNLKTGRALLDAALPLASTTGAADIIAERLQKYAAFDEKENVIIEMDVTTDGVTEKKKLSPLDAVKYMETQVDLYGTLFKSGVGAGVGGKNDPAKKVDGEIDFSKLTYEQLKEVAKKNPTALGLSRAM